MESIVFVARYHQYLSMIEKVARDEYKPAIERMKQIDPHDLVRPDTYFDSESYCIGFVFLLLINEIKKDEKR